MNEYLLFSAYTMGTTYKELFKLYDLIQSGDSRAVERFIKDNSIELNLILPCKGIGVLHLAVGIEPVEKSKHCTELILKYGGDPNLSNDDGVTPVHIAAIWGRLDNLKVLIGCGGDPFRHDLDGYSSFDYAAREEQWDVYDYLHNVIDEKEDSNGAQCAYTLDLERVLVSTEQVVAEYEPAPHDVTGRKSDMVRNWCDDGLVINKLYPTILGETYLIDTERSRENIERSRENIERSRENIDRSKEIHSKSLDDTFKTCASRKEVQISGIEPLEPISYLSRESNTKQRLSEYENFSLPGSPNCIIHKNYHTKTNLKKKNSQEELITTKTSLKKKSPQDELISTKTSLKKKSPQEELIAELKTKLSMRDTQSILTDDLSQDLDKALIVAQNKTNEWLSSCSESDVLQGGNIDVKRGNTRRSSASSGVSSNFSGSIVLANVEEEYKYEDKEEDVVLIEKRLLVSPVVLPVDDSLDSPDQTVASIASSLPPSMDYDNNALRAELISLGFHPGPILDSTKSLYLKKLHTLKKNPIVVRDVGSSKTYSVELQKSLRSADWMQNLGPYVELETKAKADFANPSRKWREGCAKTSFTYLLLDPRLTNNLPGKAGKQAQHVSWSTFVNSIFYVGKGKRSRPYSHLYQALTLWKQDFKKSNDKKVQHILDIWSDKVGVLVLHIFQNVIPAEAYTHEAAMIDVLGLQNLKNIKTGNYYGVVASWPLKERKMFGLYLLYKAMNIFFSEGERQLRPEDID